MEECWWWDGNLDRRRIVRGWFEDVFYRMKVLGEIEGMVVIFWVLLYYVGFLLLFFFFVVFFYVICILDDYF